jgi:GNAT superfamily N-acetyltransferase
MVLWGSCAHSSQYDPYAVHGYGTRRVPTTLEERHMCVDISLVTLEAIRCLRELYRQEMNCQIVHDSLHASFFTDIYLIRVNDRVGGYGCVMSGECESRDLIKEFYVLPVHRASALPIFRRFAMATGARTIEAQTNDTQLSLMLFDCAREFKSETILFHDASATNLRLPGVRFRKVDETDRDRIFPHKLEGVGDWLLEDNGEVVATGGVYSHYNAPYGDISMEVDERLWRRGYASYLVQELKRSCYEMGRIPVARCNVANTASRATLQKAGFLPCARILRGAISK